VTFGRLVWRDLWRNPLRLALTVLAGAVGVTAFIFLQTVVDVFYYGTEAARADRLLVRNKVAITQTLPLSYLPRIAAVPGVDAVTHIGWFGGRYGESQRDFFPNFYVDPSTFLEVYDELVVPPEQITTFQKNTYKTLIKKKLTKQYK
jgi:putative ABC transport system permease protein